MKLRKVMKLVVIALVVISVLILFAPLISAFSVNQSLLDGVTERGTQFDYTMDALGPVNFSRQNSVSTAISNLGMTHSYVNVSSESGGAIFSISIYGQPPGNTGVILAKSFEMYEPYGSQIYQSFFPSDLSNNGEFYHAFNVVGEVTGTTTQYATINVGKGSLYSISQKATLIGVPSQPTGYYGQLSRQMNANTAYYVNTPSNAFLSYLLFSGNSTVISCLLGSSSVTNVSLFYLHLTTENSALSALNLPHYIVQYAVIVVIVWIIGVIYLVSLYRAVSRRGKR